MTTLSLLDLATIAASLVLTFAVAWWGHHKKIQSEPSSSEGLVELMLMGRQLTLPLFVATLVSTWYGGIFGVAQIAFESGIYNFVTQGLFWYATYIIFALFLVKRIQSPSALSLAELVGEKLGKKAEKVTAILNFINVLPIAYVLSIGLLIKLFVPSIELWLASAIGTFFVISYTAFGGMRAVVFSDLVQFFLMLISVILVFIVAWSDSSLAPWELSQHLPLHYFDLQGGHDLATTLSWGFIALTTLVDPNFYQRVLAAKSPRVSRQGILISTLIWAVFDLALTFGAMYAKHWSMTNPEVSALALAKEDGLGYFTYALTILPDGLKGIFVAGIAACILSTLDSYLFLASTSLSLDVFNRKKHTNRFHRWALIIIGVLTIILSTQFEGQVKDVWKTLGGLSAATLLVPLVLMFGLKIKLNEKTFIISLIVAASIFIATKFSNPWPVIDPLYYGLASSLFITAIMPLISKTSSPDK